MADTDINAVAVDPNEQDKQAAQPAPALDNLADLVPVDESEKPLAGAHPAEATSDLVPVQGSEKNLSLPKPQEKVQPSGVIGSIGARESGFHTWLQDVQADVKTGTASTWVGSMLKKFGAKGTSYGVSEPISEFMAGPALGVPKALEGASEITSEVGHGVTDSSMDYGKTVRGVNKVIGGTFQSLGPGMMLAPEALPVVVPAMVAQAQAYKAAKYMGADDDTAELVSNVAAVVSGRQVHESLNPVIDRFGVAVNARTAAEQEYVNRSRNLETARAQAAEVQQRAVEAAGKESNGQGTPADTDSARQLSNEAAKNVADAQKAFDQASERRAASTIQLEKLGRKITSSADKTQAKDYEAKASEQKKASDFFQKAAPSKGANRYTPEDEEVFRAHAEAAKAKGEKITDLPSAYEVAEEARQGIEDKLDPYIEKYRDEPLTAKPEDSPKIKVAEKLAEMAKVDGNFDNAMSALDDFNITDPTVGEAKDILTKLNSYQRAAMKGANNWDIYNMIETNPDFAARFFMVDELRDAIHNNLEGHGVEGSRAARSETKSLVNVRDAIGAQIRANRGGTSVRGSGTQSKLRLLIGKLTGKAIKGAGIAAGAEMGGVPGAVAGGAVGGMIGQPIEDFLAPRDMTRDQHIERSFRYKGTNRKPVEIKGEGTPANIPVEKIPPAPKDLGPTAIELTPRENTELHAELAAHYGESNLEDSTYQELEQQLREDVAAKNRNGVALDPAEKNLLTKVLKADSADRATTQAANKPTGEVKIDPEKEAEILEESKIRAQEGEPTKLNSHLVSLGRGDESGLVSHSIAMKAHAAPLPIAGLPEGVTPEMAYRHEFAHLALDAVDGEPTGVEIRSDKHPLVKRGAGASSVFDASTIRDAQGNIDPEALQTSIVKWLTNKMAGPASHEVFDGMTKDDVLSHPATRSDIREARSFVRDVHPDFTPGQIEEVVDTAYDRARDFISQPHIADRIKTNAAVREEGLNETLHASRGRVSQFQRDVLEAHNEHEGTNEPQPSGDGTGKGGEKAEKPAAEEGEKNTGGSEERGGEEPRKPAGKSEAARGVVESEIGKKPATPPERSTGNVAEDEAIKAGGGVPGGMLGRPTDEVHVKMFHDPETGTTLGFSAKEPVTAEAVKAKLEASRAQYAAAEAKPEESEILKTEDNYHPDLQKLADKFGTTTDASKVRNGASFIAPDGKFIHLGSTEHPVAIESVTGREGDAEAVGAKMTRSEGAEDSRIGFMRDTGAVRTRFRQSVAGKELVASVPAKGVTEEQISALRQAVGQGLGRNGNLLIEVGEPGGKSATKEFASPRDVEPMLREIGAHPESSDWMQKAADTRGEGFSYHPRTGQAPTDGFMVETHLDRGQQYDHPPTAEDIRAFTEKNKDILDKNPDLYVGGYKNTLGISERLTDQAAAEDLGKKTNQISIYDVKNGKEIPTGGTGEVVEQSAVSKAKSPKGSSVPLMENPLPVKGTMEGGDVGTLDLTKALNKFSRKQLPALEPGSEPKEMFARARKIAEDEAKYQLAQSKTGTEWYTTEMNDHDKVLQDLRPELAEGETVDSPDAPGHPVNLTLFKAAEGILSSGQKPYANVKSAVRAWDLYKETGEFPRINPATGKSWGPRSVEAYGNAFDGVNKLIQEKGEKGAADWLLSEHPVSELKEYNKNVSGKKDDMQTGAMILGEKRGPFMQNLHGIESKFTADMWVSRTWNRWMGTLDLDPRIEAKGKMTSESDAPRNNTERSLMKESFEKTAGKLGLSTSSLQAVLWYYEQALYRAHGLPVESWSFSDAAKRVAKEASAPEEEQTEFKFGANEGKEEMPNVKPKVAGRVSAFDFLGSMKKNKK